MNKYFIVKQKKEAQYSYCGLLKYDEYFIGSEEEYINKIGTLALKNGGLVLYDPIEDTNVLMSLNQGNCLVNKFAGGEYIKKSRLKSELENFIFKGNQSDITTVKVTGYNI